MVGTCRDLEVAGEPIAANTNYSWLAEQKPLLNWGTSLRRLRVAGEQLRTREIGQTGYLASEERRLPLKRYRIPRLGEGYLRLAGTLQDVREGPLTRSLLLFPKTLLPFLRGRNQKPLLDNNLEILL
jgi:hypothetical protein